jgi:hypothetical protein
LIDIKIPKQLDEALTLESTWGEVLNMVTMDLGQITILIVPFFFSFA